jgi:hypothetical protein
MTNISEKLYRENQNTILCSITFFFTNHTVYETTWKNMAKPERQQTTIRRMRIACRMNKAINIVTTINTYSFRQQWFNEGALILHYPYISSLVFS